MDRVFSRDGKLKKISVRGGAPIVLGDVGRALAGGDWSEDGTIIFPTQFTSPLYRVSANGGTPVAATHLDMARSEITHRWPQFLPGGKAVIFTASSDNNFFGHASVDVAPLDTGVPKVLVENAYFGRYLAGGYLAYVSQGTVFVAPFDAQALKVTGTAIPVMQAVNYDISNGSAQFSVSKDGTAVHLDGGTAGQNLNLVLMDRKGNPSVLVADQPDAAVPRLSPMASGSPFSRAPATSGYTTWSERLRLARCLAPLARAGRNGRRTASGSPMRILAARRTAPGNPFTGNAPMARVKSSL